jgi:serine/threonine protein kinase
MVDAFERLSAALAGEYRLERELGQGGMARVYRAEDLKHGRRVALKLLRPELAAMLGVDRFLAEVRTMAGLQHPRISFTSRGAASASIQTSEVVHSAVVGSITDVTSDTRLAVKPPCRACSRTMASFGAR